MVKVHDLDSKLDSFPNPYGQTGATGPPGPDQSARSVRVFDTVRISDALSISYVTGTPTASDNPVNQSMIAAVERRLEKSGQKEDKETKRSIDILKLDVINLKRADLSNRKFICWQNVALIIIAVLVLGPYLLGIGKGIGDWASSDHIRNIDTIITVAIGLILLPLIKQIIRIIKQLTAKKINLRQFFRLE